MTAVATSPDYRAFLEAKVCSAPQLGFEVDPAEVSDRMKPHCRAIVPWMLRGGRRAVFASFGLHKTVMLFREYSLHQVYDFEHHVKIGEALEAKRRLPVTFMLLPPQSWHDDVWTDITRMRTLNGAQSAKGKEMHLCPLQFDIVDRLIAQLSQPGELVFDPFGGLMTVPYCALKLGRRGLGIELNSRYFVDGAAYCAAAVQHVEMPSLFSVEEPA